MKNKNLEDSTLLLKNLSKEIPGVIYIYQLFSDGRSSFPFASDRIWDIYEVTADEVKNDASKVISRIHSDDYQKVMDTILESFKSLNKWKCLYRVELPSKGVRWLKGESNPQKQDDGSVIWYGYIYDYTEQKNLEDEILKRKNQIESSADISGIGFWELDFETLIITLDDLSLKIYATNREIEGSNKIRWKEFLNKFVADDFNREIFERELSNAYKQKKDFSSRFKYKAKTRDNKYLYILVDYFIEFDNNGNPIKASGTIFDITEQKNTEIKLEDTISKLKLEQDRYKKLMELASDGIHILDKDGNVVESSLSFANMLGYEYDEVLKLNVKDWDVEISKEQLTIAIENLIKNPKSFITKHKRKDGSIFDVQINAKGIELDGNNYLYASSRDITGQKKLEEKLKDLNKNLEKRVEEEVNARREQERLLIEQSRLAQMGEMINNIAHQWRQPLNALGLILQKIKLAKNRDKLTNELIDESSQKGFSLIQKMSTTIDDFRNFFKPDKNMKVFNLKNNILTTIEIIEASFEHHNIKVLLQIDENLKLLGYPNEFSQVILNLLVNSKDEFLDKNITNPEILINAYKKNKTIYVSVLDNAGGIKENILDKIFQPYFSTKDEKKGTGLGLYMSKMIIEQNMNGKLNVKNENEGAKFIIELPVDKSNKEY